MTKQGYAQVLVSTPVYDRLKTVAAKNGLSLGKTIDRLLEYRYRIDTTALEPSHQNLTQAPIQRIEPNQAVFGEREGLETVGSQMAGPRGFEPRISGFAGFRVGLFLSVLIRTRRRAQLF